MSLELITTSRSEKTYIEATFMDLAFREDIPSELRFNIAVPKDWRVESELIVSKLPDKHTPSVLIGRLRPIDKTLDASISVFSFYIPREMHPVDWLNSYLNLQKLHKIAGREVQSSYGIIGDFLVRRSEKTKNQICRMTTFKDANRIFLVQSCAEEDLYKQYEEAFFLAMLRFRLLEPTKQKFAEPFSWKELSGSDSIRFLIPSSWQFRKPGDVPPNGSAFQLENRVDTTVAGTLMIMSTDIAFLDQIESTTIKKLQHDSFNLVGKVETKAVNAQKHAADTITVKTQQARRKEASYRFSIARLTFNDKAVLLFLISPSPDNNFEAWAINLRAFEIALDSLGQ